MSTSTEVQQLANHLKQEIAWLEELNKVLAEEKTILIERQFDKLEELANKKEALSNKLETSSKARMTLLGDPEKKNASSVLKEFIKKCDQADAQLINDLNNKLTAQLALCRELNTVNGQVITTNIHIREELVTILSGNKVKNTSVYTATGDIASPSKSEGGHHQEA
jgi:flagella synthesis protein FlgN